MRISDWSSDVCSSDLGLSASLGKRWSRRKSGCDPAAINARVGLSAGRSEEHTSELQSLMRISYAVFCLKKKKYLFERRRVVTKLGKLDYELHGQIYNCEHFHLEVAAYSDSEHL